MKKTVDLLTSENLKNLFANNFDLANFAIQMARSKIAHGESAVLTDILNNLGLMAEGKMEVKIEEAPVKQQDYDE